MLSLLSFILFWTVAAQEGARIDATKLPKTAPTVREFVPRGWEVETQIVGDLNRDSIPDLAVTLVESMPATADKDNPPERQRALLILFKTADGNYNRAALANKVLLCTRCGGAFYGVSETPTTVEIVNGIIIVTQEYGSREVTEETYRFRFEPETRRFAFIGVDLKSYDRATGEAVKESTNLLTGVKLTTKSKMAENTDKETVVANSRQRMNPKKRFLEDVAARYNEQEKK
ncbi:MAG: hypothetical protein JST85_24210 [Acidobacteria bacterium]|nr:hypothetical protein [Acidobacteriota bacterium]